MMRQKATAVYRDVGLLYRMWVRSPFWCVDFRGGPKFFGSLVDPWLKHCKFTNIIT
jgi:hypothetical protein